MDRLVVIGGGWAGCAAALAAAKKGMAVTLLERTDRLLASGLVGGIMRNNARYTAAEELKLMGAGELIAITDDCSRHAGIDFPGHRHASLYDVEQVELRVQRELLRHGVRLYFESRAVDVVVVQRRITAVRLDRDNRVVEGDIFVDASGTAGPPGNCRRFGHGCAMCVYRCPVFGSRVSIAARAGAAESPVQRPGGSPGYFSGSCELEPSSLDRRLLARVREEGVLVLPLPASLRAAHGSEALRLKACRQYTSGEYRDNIVLLDTGAVKMMLPFMPLQALRRVGGLERVIYRDPLGGSRGNSIRFSTVLHRDISLKVAPLENLFVAGERAGLALGHTEAIVTGTVAGYNAWRLSRGEEPVAMPRSTVAGELIAYTGRRARSAEGRRAVYNLSGGPLWEYIRTKGLYTTDPAVSRRRIEAAGLLDIFSG